MSWLTRHRHLAFSAICTFWTAIILLGHYFPTLPFISMPWRGEQSFEDLLRKEGRKTPTRHDFLFLGMNIDTQNNTQIVLPNAQLVSPPAQTDDRVGFVNYWNDEVDGKLRTARFFTSLSQLADVAPTSGDEIYASLATRALTKLGRAADI